MKNNEINGQPNRIEKSTIITGDIVSEADFRIDGTLEGSINTPGKVVIGKDGVINGVIICSFADIEGKFNGKLEVKESLTLKASSQLEGEAVIGKLIVESGAIFNAKCSMRSSSDVKSINKGIEKTA
ncbi:MAG: polymer-forming cytoskeletal protein [Flavobacteriaceae bacterium]|nr:polymer-forming cytoskeletal protein [Flavobacteriaceae bacterium]MDG1090905.1 polymer-forming cytoskeletal protein [Flavobacteriaceae bacterium]